jgi:3-oxoacyl-[acyl-carrier-protein] synthase II
MKKRIVVTGLGAITPIGIGHENFWKALVEGRSGVGRITAFDTEGFTTKIAAEVKDFEPGAYIDKKESRRMDRVTQFAVAAAKMALDDSGMDLETVDHTRVGTYVSSGIGGIITLGEQFKTLFEKGPNRISPLFIPMIIPNMPSGMISILFGFQGPCLAVPTACASGTNSIGEAMKIIQRGDADVMIAGGTEACIAPICIAGFSNMKALSTRNDEPERASRPFDADRDGFVMGEGAGVVVIETLEHALKRNAKIYAELCGYGVDADAYHITATNPEGLGAARCMQLALADAGLQPEDIDYVNAHGTSTPVGDKPETLAVKKVFGQHAYELKVSSNKSMLGHMLGASGGAEFIATVLTVQNDIIPPTINLDNPDPELDLDYVPHKAVSTQVRAAISNSFGFGGHNATVAVKKYHA